MRKLLEALPLDDPQWGELTHAYGSAADIPALLRQLANFPSCENYRDEPWYTLWSSLCHQGDVYSASFASVPHIIAAAAANPERASYGYLLLPASIEIARVKRRLAILRGLESSYFYSLGLLPGIVAGAAGRHWGEAFCSSALAAIAAAKGQSGIAEIVRDLEGESVSAVLKFLQDR